MITIKLDKKAISVAILILGLLIAAFSYKTYYVDAASTAGAAADVSQATKSAPPPKDTTPQEQPMPQTGLRMPGHKGGFR